MKRIIEYILSALLIIFAVSLFSEPRKKGLRIESSDGKRIRRWAVAAGINSWHDVSISKLNKAQNDAKEFSRLLKEKGEFDEIITLTDDNDPRSSLYPSRNNILTKLELLLDNAEPEDLFIFYFSGHGISDKDDNAYLMPADAVFEKPLETAVSVEYIISLFKKKNMKKTLLIVDACRETTAKVKGTGQNSIKAEKYGDTEIGAVFFSTGSGNYSYEDHESENGVFTRFLKEGISGAADADQDGIVTFSELENFVQEKVRGWSLKFNKKQRPY
ncbi:MAG TPA: caspase family protein, partial [Leptospiraceae bacterium]|nr:caspase family protein [Leptospiraceae bacterium]